MAATRDGTEGAGPAGGRPEGTFDGARLLTVGQAADLLGVAHVTLRQWVRAGRVATQLGRQGGLVVDLVRAGDLVALDPRVRERALPAATSAEPVVGARPAGAAGPGATRLTAARPVDAAAGRTARSDPAPAEWADEQTRELERLRAELAEERARSRARAAELGAVEHDLRRLLAPAQTSASRADGPMELERAAPLRHVATGRAPRAGLTPLALLPALVLGFVARPWLLPNEAPVRGAGAHLVASAPPPETTTTAVVQTSADAEAGPGAGDAATGAAAEHAAHDAARTRAVPTGSGADEGSNAGPVAGAGDFRGRLTARALRPLEYAAVDGPVCAFGAYAADLGPCMGPPTLTGAGVAGTHRVAGVDCCRHHQLAQRLGGDLAQLGAAAELARQEGVLPPLVAARVDRAVGLFVRARFGAWRSAGVDDAEVEGHHVRLDAQGVATVETWIELEEAPTTAAPAAEAPGRADELRHGRRALRLVLEVSDGPEGDVLRELATLAVAPEVAAGGALTEPGEDHVTAGTNR